MRGFVLLTATLLLSIGLGISALTIWPGPPVHVLDGVFFEAALPGPVETLPWTNSITGGRTTEPGIRVENSNVASVVILLNLGRPLPTKGAPYLVESGLAGKPGAVVKPLPPIVPLPPVNGFVRRERLVELRVSGFPEAWEGVETLEGHHEQWFVSIFADLPEVHSFLQSFIPLP